MKYVIMECRVQLDMSEGQKLNLAIHHNPVTLIPNEQESSRTSRNEEFSKFAPHSGGNFKPSHTRCGMSRNDGGMEIIYIFLDICDSAMF